MDDRKIEFRRYSKLPDFVEEPGLFPDMKEWEKEQLEKMLQDSPLIIQMKPCNKIKLRNRIKRMLLNKLDELYETVRGDM